MTNKNRKTIIKEMILGQFHEIPGYVIWVGKTNGEYKLIDKKKMDKAEVFKVEMELEDLSSYVVEYLTETNTTEADIWN